MGQVPDGPNATIARGCRRAWLPTAPRDSSNDVFIAGAVEKIRETYAKLRRLEDEHKGCKREGSQCTQKMSSLAKRVGDALSTHGGRHPMKSQLHSYVIPGNYQLHARQRGNEFVDII